MLKEKEQTYYGILLNKKSIYDEVYSYVPLYIIKGKLENVDMLFDVVQTYFIDEMENCFYTMTDTETYYNSIENVVGFMISEEELLSKYPDCSIEEAKNEYFLEICNFVYIGYYDEIKAIVRIVNINLEKLNQINNNQVNESQDIEKTEDSEYIGMTKEELKKIIDLDNYEKMKEELEKVYNLAITNSLPILGDELIEENNFDDLYNLFIKKELKGKDIIVLFNKGCDLIVTSQDEKEVIDTLEKLKETFTIMLEKLYELKQDGKRINIAKEMLTNIIVALSLIMDFKDITIIKKEMKNSIIRIKNDVIEGINIYNEFFENKEIQKENDEKNEKAAENEQEEDKLELINIKQMKNFLDDKIIGQEMAKMAVILAIQMNRTTIEPSDRTSILLVGPTGSGKTFIANTVSKYLDVPMEIVDTTQYTVAGYQGADIQDILVRLLVKTNGDIKKAESGIVVFNEIDKKGSEKNSDVSGKGVLNALLSFMEGTTYNVSYNGRTIPFKTHNLTIFATGAFTDVAKGKLKISSNTMYKETKIGFTGKLEEENDQDIIYPELEYKDFVKYGNMTNELMGRFSTIVQLSGHTKQSLKRILLESNESSILLEQAKLAKLGISLKWTDGYIDAVVEKAMKLKTGARSLKSTIENSIIISSWQVLSNIDKYCGIILTEKSVENNFDSTIIDIDGNTHKLINTLTDKQKEQMEELLSKHLVKTNKK